MVKADDITDYEIEGISVGDNLLNHFTLDQIKSAYKNNYPKSKKFYGLQFDLNNYETYEFIQVHMRANSKYIISSVVGGEFFNDINKCYAKQKIIVNDLKKNFPNAEFNEYKNNYPDDQNSTVKSSEFFLSNFEFVVFCTDWSQKAEATGLTDSLRVEIATTEFSDFIRNEAY